MTKLSREISAKIHNRFAIEVINAVTGEIKLKAQAFNIICNQLWSCLISASAVDVKGMGYPWGNLTRSYCRRASYLVLDKKSRKSTYYLDFIPLADPTQKMGWYVKFVSKEEEVKYMLNGKLIKK